VRRVAYRKAAVKVALLYPSAYQVAMSSAAYHMLYFKLQDEGFYVERFTADRGPRGVEDGTPLSHFDYVVATVHYELDYVNLVKMLIEAGIPPRAADRKRPKLVVGGPPVAANPEPLAEFVDAVAVGELEPLWGSLAQYLATGEEAEELYYPAKGPQPVEVKYAKRIEPDYRRMPEPEAAFSLAVELARGCPYTCVFCMESYITKPYRPRDWRIVLDEAEKLYSKYGVRPSIVALTANAHPGFKELLAEAARRGLRLSLPSMRAELLDEETVELLAAVGQRTLTIAPETSERLRRALGKEMSNEDVLRVAKKAGELGMRLKLYLMVGLPCERPEDVEEAASLVREVRKAAGAVSHSVNPFIPKPQTPLQYSAMAPLAYLKEKMEQLRRAHQGELSFYDPALGAIQAAISLGGRKTAHHIEAAAVSQSPLGYWKRALKSGALDYVFKPRDEPLPWSHIRGFYQPEELRRRYRQFLEQACG